MHGVIAAELAGTRLHRRTGHPRRRARRRPPARPRARRSARRCSTASATWDLADPGLDDSGCTRAAAPRTGAWTRCSRSCAASPSTPERDRVDRRRDPGVPHGHGAVTTSRRPDWRPSTASSTTSPPSRSTVGPGSTSTPTTPCSGPRPSDLMERVTTSMCPVRRDRAREPGRARRCRTASELEETVNRSHGTPRRPAHRGGVARQVPRVRGSDSSEAQRSSVELCERSTRAGRRVADVVGHMR